MKSCLVVSRFFYPGYKAGGPVRSLCNLISFLGGTLNFSVVTSDRDLGELNSYRNIDIDSWNNNYKGFPVFYSSLKLSSLKMYRRVHYDYMYLNSFFDIRFSFMFIFFSLFSIIKTNEIILAPRGELAYGAMSLKKHKKKLFIYFFRMLGLHKRVTFQFTSQQELDESLNFLGKVKYKLVSNMHENLPKYKEKNKEKGKLKLLYLARVSPKKNLKVFLKALSFVKHGDITFSIAGEIDDINYWNECESLIKQLPKNIKIKYLGAIDRVEVESALQQNQAFILPTLNENYGHSIVEAMINSNIIIISNQTPWSEVKNEGGFVHSSGDVNAYANTIQVLLEMSKEEYNSRTLQVYKYCLGELKEIEKNISNLFE
ncbi:glycosyltransferase [Colwellia sp. MB3u-70]|uniref:glycosyltransferase n=1 Tax=unclassified Colwellia TaxID=196834 RepID=UPI0015F3A130|nr:MULTISPECIES: glycosyltransferase [unclassified Colwellia]MBA6291509.1 glycosyltransferase [Colwellia sp. MB3u-8]MBA6308959.1 glycosyltransferase [Colwellia sp. MB3u-70]